MDYALLKGELTNDPLAVGYATMTDAEAANALNTPSRTIVVETYANAKTVLSTLGAAAGAAFLDALEAAAATNSAVKWAMSFITSEAGINVGDAETRSMLVQLASSGVLDSGSVSIVKALAERQVSRAVELGLGEVTEGDVQFARSMP